MVVLTLPRAQQLGQRHTLHKTPIHISGLACVTGQTSETKDHAIAKGAYTQAQAQKDGYSAVKTTQTSVPDMSIRVADSALAQAQLSGGDLGLVVATSIHDHGHARLWQPAAYIKHNVGAQGALAWSTSFGCNGLVISVLQAALLQPSLKTPVLAVGADRFDGTGFNRWTSDQGLVYGDAASAVALSGKSGFAELLYLAVDYAPELEALHRHPTPTYLEAGAAWDITACKRGYIDAYGGSAFFDALNGLLDDAEAGLKHFLEHQGITLKAVVTPFVGESIRATTYDARFHPMAALNTSAFGASVGHTGTSDPFLGFAHLIDSKAVEPGDHVLLIGAGAGFSISAMVVRLNARPVHPLLGDI